MQIDMLNRVDFCLVVDTTGSMGTFLSMAKQHLTNAVRALSADANLDLRVGVVEYRDHPPQEKSFLTKVYPLTGDLGQVQKVIDSLQAMGGGDSPEAVFDGVVDACEKQEWREHSLRLALLVGDAPPHGAMAHRAEPGQPARDTCPCGYTVHSVTAAAESRGVTVHALAMSAHKPLTDAFSAIAVGTGGSCVVADQASKVIETLRGVLAREFGSLELDRQVWEAVQAVGTSETATVAAHLNMARGPVASALARLEKRELGLRS